MEAVELVTTELATELSTEVATDDSAEAATEEVWEELNTVLSMDSSEVIWEAPLAEETLLVWLEVA